MIFDLISHLSSHIGGSCAYMCYTVMTDVDGENIIFNIHVLDLVLIRIPHEVVLQSVV